MVIINGVATVLLWMGCCADRVCVHAATDVLTIYDGKPPLMGCPPLHTAELGRAYPAVLVVGSPHPVHVR